MAKLHPWQAVLWQKIASRAQQAHAYLLHGAEGSGKRDFAGFFAHFLLCLQPRETGACGRCKGCLLIAAGSHPDLFVLEPATEKKTVGVDDVRQLIEFVNKTAQMGGRKVILIAEPPIEDMTLAASNALLKSLEEPAGNTVMLLVSHQMSRLLPTIKSRCVLQACPQPSTEQSLKFLQNQLPELTSAALLELLILSGGSPLTALKHHQADILTHRRIVVEGVKKLLKQQLSPTQFAEQCKAMSVLLLLDWFIDWSKRAVSVQLTQTPEQLGLEDMAKVVQYLADKTQPAALFVIHDWLIEQRQKVLGKGNLNGVLLLEALFVRWANLPRAR